MAQLPRIPIPTTPSISIPKSIPGTKRNTSIKSRAPDLFISSLVIRLITLGDSRKLIGFLDATAIKEFTNSSNSEGSPCDFKFIN